MATARITVPGTVFIGLLLGASLMRVAQAEPLKILMIGNSYTQGNATARATSLDLQGLFDADPNFSASITVRADSSASLQNHANNSVTTNLITNPANTWDVIVLQERSERPALAMKYGGSELSGLNNGGPVLISNYITPNQPQAAVVLFDTWARQLGNQDLIDDFDNNPKEMLFYTNQGYARIEQNPPAWDYSAVTTIAPVGDAWDDWYDTYGYGGPNGLHLSDGSHQNDLGAYLAAAVLFETITGKTSIGNNYAGAVTGTIDGISRVLLLQQQASAITGAPFGLTGDYDGDGIIDAADYTAWRDSLASSSTTLLNDPTPGAVDESDFLYWRAHFGESLSGGSGSSSFSLVPEPSTLSHLFLAIASLSGCANFQSGRRAAKPKNVSEATSSATAALQEVEGCHDNL
jgi:Domain of unknown function (DUF4886)